MFTNSFMGIDLLVKNRFKEDIRKYKLVNTYFKNLYLLQFFRSGEMQPTTLNFHYCEMVR